MCVHVCVCVCVCACVCVLYMGKRTVCLLVELQQIYIGDCASEIFQTSLTVTCSERHAVIPTSGIVKNFSWSACFSG